MSRANSHRADTVRMPSNRRKTRPVLAALLMLPALTAFAACGTARVATSRPDGQMAAAAGNGLDGSTAPAAACEPARGPGMTVVGAFATTVGGVRQWQAQQIAMDAKRAGRPSSSIGHATWSSERSTGTKAVLCYLDGTIDKAPPPAPDGTATVPFNRAIIAVLEDGSVTAVTLGYQGNIPVHAPPAS